MTHGRGPVVRPIAHGRRLVVRSIAHGKFINQEAVVRPMAHGRSPVVRPMTHGRRLVVRSIAHTGGKPLFTHQVHAEFIVGSEPKYPAWAHQVHLDYFYSSPTNLPSICPPGTCWVFSKSTHRGTQHGPTEHRLGTF